MTAAPPRPGRFNALTDVPGLRVGHATHPRARSGVSVVLCPGLTRAAVDCRGGGPATRETDALDPDRLVSGVHALVFAGGSVFGLAAADGVAAWLSAAGVGLRLRPGAPPVPLVPCACVYDLGAPGDKNWGREPPYRLLGEAAADVAASAAGAGAVAQGSVGAGAGAVAGAWKGGVGSASLDLGRGLVVAALMAANPVGAVTVPSAGAFWAAPFEIGAEFGGLRADPTAAPAAEPMPPGTKLAAVPGGNTTVGVVATTADLTAAECRRLAIMAQDGLARAIRPAHTPFDGDTVFALATGAAPLPPADAAEPLPGAARAAALARLGSAAADCAARAVARAVWEARAAPDEAPAFRQWIEQRSAR